MVAVVQLVEHQVVILDVAGSSPVSHPKRERTCKFYTVTCGFVGVIRAIAKIMTVPRRILTTTLLVGLAVAAAGTAWAAPTMNGHYLMTVTSDSGQTTTSDWYFTSCGNGCASVAVTPDAPSFGQAQFRDGQWTLVWHSDVVCPGGTHIPGALSSYDTWDPITLAGTDQATTTLKQTCGNDARLNATQRMQLAPAG